VASPTQGEIIMQICTHRHATRCAVLVLAVSLSAISIGCTISGGQIGVGVGVGTNGRATGTVGGTITFRSSALNEMQVVDADTGQAYTDDGTLDYSAVVGTEGTTLGGSVYSTGGGGGGGGGGGCGGEGYCQNEFSQQ
jgi:hypothetical protein